MTGARTLTTDAVIEFDGKVLLMKRTHPPFEGSWALPGGFVEQDETAREACVRETKEEVGLSIVIEEWLLPKIVKQRYLLEDWWVNQCKIQGANFSLWHTQICLLKYLFAELL